VLKVAAAATTVLVASAIAPQALASERAASSRQVGQTQVATWRDGKRAAVVLTFDDNLPSQRENAIPALRRCEFPATFFVNPGMPGFNADDFWSKQVPAMGFEYGVHTMRHRVTAETADADVAECVRILDEVSPNSTPLRSFARPGPASAWPISRERTLELLRRHQLASRDEGLLMYAGQPLAMLTRHVDEAVASGGVVRICFHGVGGDYLSVDLDVFNGLLAHLDRLRDQVWVADHLSMHKYRAQRKAASASGRQVDARRVEVALTGEADPALYDATLTLNTRVPGDWKRCAVRSSCGRPDVEADVVDGSVRYAVGAGSKVVVTLEQK
jgi:hypothetical protein